MRQVVIFLLFSLSCWISQIQGLQPVRYPDTSSLEGPDRVAASREIFVPLEFSQDTLQFSPWDLVMSLDWSPDGHILAIASGTWINFYNVLDGTFISQTNIGSFTPDLDFSPDGRWLAAGSRDGHIRLWQIGQAGETSQWITLQREIEAHPKGVNSVDFNDTGEMLASGGNDAIARLWEVGSGKLLNEVIGGTFAVPAVAIYSPDESLSAELENILAVVNGEVLRLRDALSGRFTGTFRSDQRLFRLAFSPDGRLLATGDISNGIKLWDVSQAYRTGSEAYPKPVFESSQSGIPGKPSGLVWAVAFHPSGDWLASAGGDGLVYLWDIHNGELIKTYTGHMAAITSLAFSPDGNWLVSGGLDAAVHFWEVK